MKVFIVRKEEENNYSIFKVSDDLIDEFKKNMGEKIVLEGKDIADAIIQFGVMEKPEDFEFSTDLQKFKGPRENIQEESREHRPKMRIK